MTITSAPPSPQAQAMLKALQTAVANRTAIDQGRGVLQDATPSLRANFRQCLLPDVFDSAVRAINRTNDGWEWLTDRQLEDLRSQLLRHPNRTLLDAKEAMQAMLFKAKTDLNELTGEPQLKAGDFGEVAVISIHARHH
jgi:type I restriction enzyme, R subunit